MLVDIKTAAEEQQIVDQLLSNPLGKVRSSFWRYPEPAVILGRSQAISEELANRAKRLDVEIVRRSSGGGAVMAGPWMLGGVVAFDIDHALAKLSLPASFECIGELWQRVLRDVGVSSEMVGSENLEKKKSEVSNKGLEWVCFAGLSHGELTNEQNRKLLGLAQIRRKNGVAIVIGLNYQPTQWELLLDVWFGESWRKQEADKSTSYLRSLDNLTTSVEQSLCAEDREKFSRETTAPALAELVDSFERALKTLAER